MTPNNSISDLPPPDAASQAVSEALVAQIHQEIQKHIPGFSIRYNPDFRQAIAETWPQSVDDSLACKDWGFKQNYDLERMTRIMLKEIQNKLK